MTDHLQTGRIKTEEEATAAERREILAVCVALAKLGPAAAAAQDQLLVLVQQAELEVRPVFPIYKIVLSVLLETVHDSDSPTVRLKIICNEIIKHVCKSESCARFLITDDIHSRPYIYCHYRLSSDAPPCDSSLTLPLLCKPGTCSGESE